MEMKRLGNTNLLISKLGLGTQGLSVPGRPSETQAISTIHQALKLGINLIDSSDAYCLDEEEKHHNERLIFKALSQYDGDINGVIVATKGGYKRTDGQWILNGNPDHLRQTIRSSFDALGGNKPIDIWFHHRPDPKYSIEQSLTAVKEAVEDGYIKFVGVSNYSLKEIKRARKIVRVVAVQNQLSPWYREAEIDGVLKYCTEENITFMASSPLGSIGGARRTTSLESLSEFHRLAHKKGISIYCILLAWLMAKSPAIIPLVGARRPSSILDSAKSVSLKLSKEECRTLNQSAPFSALKHYLRQIKNQVKNTLTL